jgi:hypothetical protein
MVPLVADKMIRTLFRLGQFDDFIRDLCIHFHGAGSLYCTYGDGIFAGYWYCMRTRHEPTAKCLCVHGKIVENDNMKAIP